MGDTGERALGGVSLLACGDPIERGVEHVKVVRLGRGEESGLALSVVVLEEVVEEAVRTTDVAQLSHGEFSAADGNAVHSLRDEKTAAVGASDVHQHTVLGGDTPSMVARV